MREKLCINQKHYVPRSRGVIWHIPLRETVSLVSSEVDTQTEVLQEVRLRRN